MEAYKVWVTLNLRGDAHKKMEQFLAIVRKTNAEVNKLIKSLEKFNIHFQTLSGTLGSVNPQVKIFNTSVHQSINIMNSASVSATRLSNSLTKVYVASQRASGGRGHGGFAHGAFVGLGARHYAGMGAAAGGYAAGHLAMSAYHTGSDYQKEMATLTGQNIPGLGREQIEAFIGKNKNPHISRLGMLSALVESASITKSAKEAMGVAPEIARLQYVTEITGKKGFSHDQFQAALKTAEIVSGSKDSQVLNKHIEMMYQSYLSSGYRVDPQQFLSVARRSRGHARSMDPNFFYFGNEPLIQEYGKSVGPMEAQFYQHLQAGRLTTEASQNLVELGIVNEKDIKYNKVGNIKGIKAGGILGKDIMEKNIFDWIDKILKPAMNKMGLKTTSQQGEVLGKIFTNTDLTIITTYLQQIEKIRAVMEANAKTMNTNEMERNIKGIHAEHLDRLTKSFSNFKLILDQYTGPLLDKAADGLSVILNLLTGFLRNDMDVTKEGGARNQSGAGAYYDLIRPYQTSNSTKSSGDVYLDSEKVGKIVFSKTNSVFNSLVQHGTTAVNGVSSPFSTALNYTGQTGQ